MSERFTLDEDAAREWLGRAATQNSDDYDGPWNDDLPDISPGWRPYDGDDDGSKINQLVYLARYVPVISGPEGASVEYEGFCSEGESGFRWLVYANEQGSVILASLYEETRRLGDRTLTGADVALSILREAVAGANHLLDELEARYTARA